MSDGAAAPVAGSCDQTPLNSFHLSPASDGKRSLLPGDCFSCGLTLFGDGIRALPVFYAALAGIPDYPLGPAWGQAELVGIESLGTEGTHPLF